MAEVSTAILGLGRVGASVALALRRQNDDKTSKNHFVITAADTRPAMEEEARKLKIAEHISRRVLDAAHEKDIIVLALPYADVEPIYEQLGAEARLGAVILDLSPLKMPSQAWAKKYLPESVHMIGMTPVVNPKHLFDGLDDTAHASADYFDGGSMLVMPAASAAPDAVELASGFAALLGSTPHFVDAAEHDSLVAATEGLPAILGVVAFYMLNKSAGWGDAQRVTNPSFGRLTHHLFDTHPDDLRDELLHNRANLTRQIDQMVETLTAFRAILAANDRDALEAALVDASDQYSAWINHRHNADWDERSDVAPSAGSVMSNMLGGFVAGRFGRRDMDDDSNGKK